MSIRRYHNAFSDTATSHCSHTACYNIHHFLAAEKARRGKRQGTVLLSIYPLHAKNLEIERKPVFAVSAPMITAVVVVAARSMLDNETNLVCKW